MSDHDAYDAWLRSRRRAELSEGFADRVMAAVEQIEAARIGRLALLWQLAVASHWGRVLLCLLAGLVCAARAVQVFAIFIVP
jgi:hypothetical protein